MSDPLRTNLNARPPSIDGEAERDAKIESLLMSGLDHYFAADYAQAIDVWTRALFLDRNHARARAYIERARSAMAEQQRESEEMLHNGIAAFERGEIEAARQMLNAAVQRGGAHDVALAFLTRIDRISAATPEAPAPAAAPLRLPFRPRVDVAAGPRSRWPAVVLSMLIIVAGIVALRWSDQIRAAMPAFSTGAEDGLAPAKVVQEPIVVPRSADAALERARSLFASGRLYDALRAIELIRPTDALRGEADRLKAAIQRELLAFQTPSGRRAPATNQ